MALHFLTALGQQLAVILLKHRPKLTVAKICPRSQKTCGFFVVVVICMVLGTDVDRDTWRLWASGDMGCLAALVEESQCGGPVSSHSRHSLAKAACVCPTTCCRWAVPTRVHHRGQLGSCLAVPPGGEKW